MKKDDLGEDRIVEMLRRHHPKSKRSAREIAQNAMRSKRQSRAPLFLAFAGATAALLLVVMLPQFNEGTARVRGASDDEGPRVVLFSGETPGALFENRNPRLNDYVSAEVVFSTSDHGHKKFRLYLEHQGSLREFSNCEDAPSSPQSIRLNNAFRLESVDTVLVLALFDGECSMSESQRALSSKAKGVWVHPYELIDHTR